MHRFAFIRQVPLRKASRLLLRAGVGALVAAAVGPAAIAAAEPPTSPPNVTITSPLNGSSTNNQTPAVSGTTDDIFGVERFPEEPAEDEDVNLTIYAGEKLVVDEAKVPTNFLDGTWSLAVALAPGVYTALAKQHDAGGTETSKAVTFTIDITPPAVTLSTPINGSSTNSSSELVAGSAGTASGDSSTVFVHLYAGATTAAQANLETLEKQASNGSWSATFGGLGPGTYTVQAEQKDEAGNTGMSAAAEFMVNAPPAPVTTTPSPPVASFRWFPSAPAAGEPVSLVSTSTDASSPITAFAWALTGSGAFDAGKPVLTTSFATPGNHVVRLQVTDANGLASTATEAIAVAARALPLMLPVPIVRIAGSETSSGVKISLLTVQSPVAAHVTVTCRGHGCPRKSVSVLARASKKSKASSVQIAFRRFERALPAGVILQIRVWKPGEIGKYTRFVIRRHTLPVRVDECLQSEDPNPIVCPS